MTDPCKFLAENAIPVHNPSLVTAVCTTLGAHTYTRSQPIPVGIKIEQVMGDIFVILTHQTDYVVRKSISS